MKKTIIITMLLMAPFMLIAQTFNFNEKGNNEGWKVNKKSKGTVKKGVLKIEPNNDKNPHVAFKRGIEASEAKFCHIKIKNLSSTANQLRFYFPRTTKPERDFFINATLIPSSKDFVIITLPTDAIKPANSLTDLDGWEDTVEDITIRFTDRTTHQQSTDVIEIDYIIFNNNPTME